MATKKFPWTMDEINILKENYSLIGLVGCANMIPNRSVAAIAAQVSKLNLKLSIVRGCVDGNDEEKMTKERDDIISEVEYLMYWYHKNDDLPVLEDSLRNLYMAKDIQPLTWWYIRRNFKLGQFMELFVKGYEWKVESKKVVRALIEMRSAVEHGAFELSGIDPFIYSVVEL